MTTLQAILWDVDGTLAETERDGHRIAFNQAFEALGLMWRWDEAYYGHLLNITGGRERLRADMAQRPDAPPTVGERDALVEELHRRKTAIYTALVRETGIPLRPGVRELVEEARDDGIRQAITTTTSRANVEALLGLHFGKTWRQVFEVAVCGEDVAKKKPDPEVFLRALKALNLNPLQAVAIEDSPGGVAAALAAEVPVVVARSAYFAQATLEGAIAIGPGLHSRDGWRPALAGPGTGPVSLDDLRAWHQEMDSVSQFG
ncbi:MAG: HAD-IA family hydrolase [Burkholderiaceae bacterium]|nr:HAD-IA family hydrolase [Rhodoferax sp.]MCP5284597.1 HAD-IA family hydrolase [Burkholderiaceae bacterium]